MHKAWSLDMFVLFCMNLLPYHFIVQWMLPDNTKKMTEPGHLDFPSISTMSQIKYLFFNTYCSSYPLIAGGGGGNT